MSPNLRKEETGPDKDDSEDATRTVEPRRRTTAHEHVVEDKRGWSRSLDKTKDEERSQGVKRES